jgi:superfamily I DNA/RNA helicase
VEAFGSFQEETKAIAEYLRVRREEGEALRNTCVIARTSSLLDNYDGVIQGEGLDTYRIRADRPEDRSVPGVRMATMHRAKGLEFDRVIIAGVAEGIVPLSRALASADDEATREQVLKQERSLLYVSATRAKREVIVTCHDEPSRWLHEAKDD